ncbi:GNAT family N-acetyltransferase [Streptomyces sp. NPDC001843]|uniref:GNAT family N-acetyltransferase n=1 Tax=Streptomyces sp. NPDC001843 TaxID=3364617 RepID=UPI0036A5CE07
MDHAGVLALYDRDMRAGARPDAPGARVECTGTVTRQVADDPGWNGVLWSDLDDTSADAAIADQIAFFTGLGRGFEWKLHGHDVPADLGSRLTAAGFAREPEETLMVAETAAPAPDAEPPAGVRLVPATDRAGVDLVVTVHEKVFGTDGTGLRRRLLARLDAAPDTVVAVVALVGDEPVGAARMELTPGTPFAGLWGGGTVEAWRGRGVYRALVAHRARTAAALGYRYLQVDASALSRPILKRLGFHPLTTTTPYVHGVRSRSLPSRRRAAVSGAPSTGRARRRPVPPGRSG